MREIIKHTRTRKRAANEARVRGVLRKLWRMAHLSAAFESHLDSSSPSLPIDHPLPLPVAPILSEHNGDLVYSSAKHRRQPHPTRNPEPTP